MAYYKPPKKLENQILTLRDKLLRLNPEMTQEQALEKARSAQLLKEKELEININNLFSDVEQQSNARELLRKYLTDYNIETISDKNTLRQLIYLEVLNKQLQDLLNESLKPLSTGKIAVDGDLVELIHKNVKQVSDLKDKLGVSHSAKTQQKKDAFTYLETLKKKYNIWLSQNQASRYLICPHCGESVLLRIKTDAWEAQRHPFFRDRVLGNFHLIKLYKEDRLSKEDLAKIFEVSPDYIDWLVGRWKV